jgi:hypothetical protein
MSSVLALPAFEMPCLILFEMPPDYSITIWELISPTNVMDITTGQTWISGGKLQLQRPIAIQGSGPPAGVDMSYPTAIKNANARMTLRVPQS